MAPLAPMAEAAADMPAGATGVSPAAPASASIATVLQAPRFLFLVVGQTVSQLGDRLHHMALIALVGAAAASASGGLELAKLSVAFTAPVVLFGPLAGALVDRWDLRRTMVTCDALRALLVATIPAAFAATRHLWVVYAIASLVFLLGVFFNAAKMAFIPVLVPRAHLLPANAALAFVGRVATVAGVIGGGFLIGAPAWRRLGWTDYAAGFYLDAASYLVSVLTLLGLLALSRRPTPAPGEVAPRPPATPRPVRGPAELLADVRRTLHIVRVDPMLRFVFRSQVTLALFASTVYVVMTYAVQTLFGRGPAGVGVLAGVLGSGMIAGALLVGTVGRVWRTTAVIVRGTTLIGVLMLLAGVAFSEQVFVPVAFLGGLALAPVMVAQDTLLHQWAPAEARALLFGTKDLVVAGVFMLSALSVGGVILLLGRVGMDDPYRLALTGIGALIVLTGLARHPVASAPPAASDR